MPIWQAYPYLTLALALIAVTTAVGAVVPAVASLPKAWTNFDGSDVEGGRRLGSTSTYFDAIDGFRTSMLVWLLNPVRNFLEGFPWLAAVILLGLAAFTLGGLKLMLVVLPLTLFCAVTGLGRKAWPRFYSLRLATIISVIIGIR